MGDFEILESRLLGIYDAPKTMEAIDKIRPLLEAFQAKKETRKELFSEQEIVLITYGDSLKKKGHRPLKCIG